MGILASIGNVLDGVISGVFGLILTVLDTVVELIINVTSFFIEIAANILGWISGVLHGIAGAGQTESTAHIVDGNAFVNYIQEQEKMGKVTEINFDTLMKMRNSTYTILSDKDGKIIDDQAHHAEGGLSEKDKKIMNGNPVGKITIPPTAI